MPIFDFRLRPPMKSYLDTMLYQDGNIMRIFTERYGMQIAPSVKEKSMDLLVEEMDAADVVGGLIVGRETSVYGSVDNADLKAIVDAYPGRFVAAAAFNPMALTSIDSVDRKAVIEKIRQAMALGFKTVDIEPGLCDVPMFIDDARLYPIYAYCEDENIPIVLMSGGLAGPDIDYTAPRAIDRVCRDFPTMKIAAAHAGWPWVREILHVALRRPNLYLSPDCYLFNFPGMDEYVEAADSYLADRMLYGSAYPVTPVKDYAEWFRTLPIRPENMERMMYTNAVEFLGLEG